MGLQPLHAGGKPLIELVFGDFQRCGVDPADELIEAVSQHAEVELVAASERDQREVDEEQHTGK